MKENGRCVLPSGWEGYDVVVPLAQVAGETDFCLPERRLINDLTPGLARVMFDAGWKRIRDRHVRECEHDHVRYRVAATFARRLVTADEYPRAHLRIDEVRVRRYEHEPHLLVAVSCHIDEEPHIPATDRDEDIRHIQAELRYWFLCRSLGRPLPGPLLAAAPPGDSD